MKNLYVILFASLILLIGFGCGPKPDLGFVESADEIITDSSGLKNLSMSDLITELTKNDVIFIGEIHDDSLTHVYEYELLQHIYKVDNQLAVAMEMFERDVQPWLSSYLKSEITETEFLKNSRPWGNYEAAYKPIIEFSKKNGLPVLAGFVPRRFAAMVARMGEEALTKIPTSERGWAARELKSLDDVYKKRFFQQMGGMGKPKMMGKMNLDNIYKAQCIKDDTMAETISDFLAKNSGTKVVTYQGDFHSAFGLGSVKKLNLLQSSLKTIVVSIVPVDDFGNFKPADYKDQGDFLIFVPRVKQAR